MPVSCRSGRPWRRLSDLSDGHLPRCIPVSESGARDIDEGGAGKGRGGYDREVWEGVEEGGKR